MYDKIEYWNADKENPEILEYEVNPLPSDSQFR